jgi:hypothetical protein
MGEVVSMVGAAGFRVVEAYYSIVNDLTLVDAEPEGYPRISGFFDLVRLFVKRPSRLNARDKDISGKLAVRRCE